jgi:probable phosphoglycerate mutase
MRLLLLRHGQTSSNVIGALDTAVPGAPLTALGEAQARAVPVGFEGVAVSSIHASTLTRTQQTAHPLALERGLDVTILDGLKEIQAGSLEMLSDHKSQGEYVATVFAWARGDVTVRMPGGENGVEFFDRFDTAIAEVVKSGGADAVVVSHGAAIRTWVAARVDDLGGSFAGSHQLDNTGLATLESSPSHSWRLVDWHAAPIGGDALKDATAVDPTGESLQA